jgi:hypothetical protein
LIAPQGEAKSLNSWIIADSEVMVKQGRPVLKVCGSSPIDDKKPRTYRSGPRVLRLQFFPTGAKFLNNGMEDGW